MGKLSRHEQVVKLRKVGFSIKEISRKLNISLSTVAYWCRNAVLTKKELKNLGLINKEKIKEGRFKGALVMKERKQAEKLRLNEEGQKEIGKLNDREFLCSGVALYWAEGTRKQETISVTSSDPNIVLFMKKWFERFLGKSTKDFSLRVQINKSHKDRAAEVENYWSKITKIPRSHFGKTTLLHSKRKKLYDNYREYFGTVRLLVKGKGSRSLHRRIMGWIEGLKHNI